MTNKTKAQMFNIWDTNLTQKPKEGLKFLAAIEESVAMVSDCLNAYEWPGPINVSFKGTKKDIETEGGGHRHEQVVRNGCFMVSVKSQSATAVNMEIFVPVLIRNGMILPPSIFFTRDGDKEILSQASITDLIEANTIYYDRMLRDPYSAPLESGKMDPRIRVPRVNPMNRYSKEQIRDALKQETSAVVEPVCRKHSWMYKKVGQITLMKCSECGEECAGFADGGRSICAEVGHEFEGDVCRCCGEKKQSGSLKIQGYETVDGYRVEGVYLNLDLAEDEVARLPQVLAYETEDGFVIENQGVSDLEIWYTDDGKWAYVENDKGDWGLTDSDLITMLTTRQDNPIDEMFLRDAMDRAKKAPGDFIKVRDFAFFGRGAQGVSGERIRCNSDGTYSIWVDAEQGKSDWFPSRTEAQIRGILSDRGFDSTVIDDALEFAQDNVGKTVVVEKGWPPRLGREAQLNLPSLDELKYDPTKGDPVLDMQDYKTIVSLLGQGISPQDIVNSVAGKSRGLTLRDIEDARSMGERGLLAEKQKTADTEYDIKMDGDMYRVEGEGHIWIFGTKQEVEDFLRSKGASDQDLNGLIDGVDMFPDRGVILVVGNTIAAAVEHAKGILSKGTEFTRDDAFPSTYGKQSQAFDVALAMDILMQYSDDPEANEIRNYHHRDWQQFMQYALDFVDERDKEKFKNQMQERFGG